MFVWPPMPLHPLDDGLERKFAHSDRLALPMTNAPASLNCWTMNASPGVLPASAQEPAVVGMPVVLMLSLTMIGMPRSGRSSPRRRAASAARASARAVGLTVMTALRRRVELADPVQVELGQLHGLQPVRVHELLELRDRRRVDVDARDPGVRRLGREADRAGYPEQEGQQGRQNKGTPNSAAHRVTSMDRVGWTLGPQVWGAAVWGLNFYTAPAVKPAGGIDHDTLWQAGESMVSIL